ncbi:hypothetical protein ColLi_11433 [Colletotrichum liriopes]|uniref:PD-(D/E)XK nuclease-like domain-containing protein n=1 Tax=Colletotrichum liriopes TaxID=708192 RepID=A0AA37GWG7_9PEZI|nr:hypothetical protein ColLi_11433 [Colletotrichum liriopes]
MAYGSMSEPLKALMLEVEDLGHALLLSMRAQIIKDYIPQACSGRMVDYVLCIYPLQATFARDSSHDDDEPATITATTNSLRESAGTVSHTDYSGLCEWPLANFLSRHTDKDALAKLEFIPGLMVAGDQWKFVAFSNTNGEKVAGRYAASPLLFTGY